MGGRYVGIDLHRRRSVIDTMGADGGKVDCVRIANEPLTLLEIVSAAGFGCGGGARRLRGDVSRK